ncbi:ATP-binding protein [Bradyrhizobium sp. LB11.1]|uniref:ATP-binding protein n=1 Tax=Bradyrhizobium sp. LB11.1 TaxID=3156326 RepID=UPI0033907B2C
MPSATRHAATIARLSIIASQDCSKRWRLRGRWTLCPLTQNPGRAQLLFSTIEDCRCSHLLEVPEDRHDRASTIVTSQLPCGTWHEVGGVSTYADAVLDRLAQNAHRLQLDG